MTRRGSNSKSTANRAQKTAADWRRDDPNLELEKSRYADPIASRELLLKHLGEAPEPLSAARLAKRLGLHTDAQRDALAKRLAAMVRDGQAIEGPNGFAVAGEGERVAGRVRGRANGDVLVHTRRWIRAPWCWRAPTLAALMHNDRVEVLAVGMNERGRRIARLIRRIGGCADTHRRRLAQRAIPRLGNARGSGPLVHHRSVHARSARREGRR